MLRQDLNAIAETIKQRTVQQIKAALQKKAFDDAGIAIQSISSPATSQKIMQGITNFSKITFGNPLKLLTLLWSYFLSCALCIYKRF